MNKPTLQIPSADFIMEEPIYKNKRMILVFDTETTGLFPKTGTEYPYILQLSFILFDTQTKKILHAFNRYIKTPDNVVVSPFITNLTGITKEMCDSGVNIVAALHEFYRAYKLCDVIVAHNISFDRQMIEVEIIRNYSTLSLTIPAIAFMFNPTYNSLENKHQSCTMAMGKNICNILTPCKNNPANSYKKNPKLDELYEKLFDSKIPNAHDALYDTIACLKCYLKILHKIDIDISP
jgi:DNA polymerase III epsilon subunit-like protein